MALNVDRSNDDPFYRYKMPRIIAKVEGKGNGIKTVIVNMHDVAKALARPPTYPTKFFGCELGAQTQFDVKNDRYIVNGSHTADRLQTLLDIFIKKFVLCPGCSNPETNLQVLVKKGFINQRCIACGYNGIVDMAHKLTTYILKNPPDQDPNATTPSKGKKDDKKKKSKKDDDEKKDRSSPESAHTTPASAQAQMAAMRESGKTMDMPEDKDGDEDDDDWGDEFTEEAVQQRMNELSEAAKGLAMTDDLEKSAEDRLNMLYEKIKIKRDDGSLTKPADIKEVFGEAERLEVKDKVPLILVELLLNEKAIAQLPKYKTLFLRFCYQNLKAQKSLLGGLEILIAKEYPKVLLPKTSHVLKFLYDEDIVEESVLLEWDKKPSKKYLTKEETAEIRKEAQMCIQWLQQAEEESDEEEEEDADAEIIYSVTEKVGEVKKGTEPASTTTPATTPATPVNGTNGKAAAEEEEDDDLDIDDI